MSIMRQKVKAIYAPPEEFELAEDCYNVTVALMHESNKTGEGDGGHGTNAKANEQDIFI